MSDDAFLQKLGEFHRLLHRHLGGQGRNFGVSLQEGVVVLRGISTTYYGKLFAQHVALHVFDPNGVVNEIEVRTPPPGLDTADSDGN